MAALHKNRVKMTVTSVASAGVGTITLNAASSAHQSFGTAYGANATVDILITEGTSWEIARNCNYTHSGTTVDRGTLEASSTGSAVTFTSAAVVEEILTAGVGNSFTDFVGAWGGLNEENAITGTATAVFGKLNVCSGTSANYTVTLPAVSGNSGKYLGLRMDAALTKLVTIDGNSSETIDGATTRVMWAQETALLYCNGATWTKVAGKSRLMTCLSAPSGNTTVTTASETRINLNTIISDPTGLMADTGNNVVKILRDGTYRIVPIGRLNNATNAMVRFYLGAYRDRGGSITQWIVQAESSISAGSYAYVTIAIPIPLLDGDKLEFHAGGPTVASESLRGDGTTEHSSFAVEELSSW